MHMSKQPSSHLRVLGRLAVAASLVALAAQSAWAGGLDSLTRALDLGVQVVGGIPHFERTMADGAESVRLQEARIAEADVVMAQLETPLDAVIEAARLAKQHGKPFILNPAPAQTLPKELLDLVDVLTPNAYELAISLGLSEKLPPEELVAQAPCQVVMTLGAKGALFSDTEGQQHQQSSFPVTPVDTTGAGDTFNGALARYWDRGLTEAVRLACAAAALSVTRAGAQSGMPDEAALQAFLQSSES
jgi:ribokinase